MLRLVCEMLINDYTAPWLTIRTSRSCGAARKVWSPEGRAILTAIENLPEALDEKEEEEEEESPRPDPPAAVLEPTAEDTRPAPVAKRGASQHMKPWRTPRGHFRSGSSMTSACTAAVAHSAYVIAQTRGAGGPFSACSAGAGRTTLVKTEQEPSVYSAQRQIPSTTANLAQRQPVCH